MSLLLIRNIVAAAYHVCRFPTLHNEESSWSSYERLDLDGTGSSEKNEQTSERTWAEAGKDEDFETKIKTEETHDVQILQKESCLDYSVNQSWALDVSQEYGAPHDQDGLYSGLLDTPSLGIDGVEGCSSLIVQDQRMLFPCPLDEPQPGIGDEYLLSRNGYDPGPFISEEHRGWSSEEWTLAHFDYDLACSPIFAVQLEDYKKRMGAFSQGAEAIRIKVDETGSMKDRLHVWPEQVQPAEDTIEGSLKAIQERDPKEQAVVIYEENSGEAAWLMDWWCLQGHGC